MDGADGQLEVPAGRGHISSVHLPDQWFIACRSRELREAPLGRTLQGTPLVLFREAGGSARALLDRCPHRNVPLSAGSVRAGGLECRYHGWRFDGQGRCVAIPGLLSAATGRARNAQPYATLEQQGFVWVYSTPGVEPASGPYLFPFLDDRRYHSVRRTFRAEATMHAVLENTLDVPHTAFLHSGLFRTARKEHEIEVVVRRSDRQVEAEFKGEPRPKGIAGRLLAPGGGVVEHFDRFILPCVAQVEYRLGESSHLIVTSAHTPIGDFDTEIHAVVTFRLPVPGWLVRPLVTPIATRIFRQDAWMLKLQSATLRRLGGERYATTELDVLGPQIWRMLRAAGRQEPLPPEEPTERRVRMQV